MKLSIFSCALFFISFTEIIHAQCLMRQVELTERIAESSTIVEARIISKNSTWDNQHRNIYTFNEIEVYKIFKGTSRTDKMTVITEGGVVDGESEVVTPSAQLKINDVGILLLKPFGKAKSVANVMQEGILYEIVASAQGFLVYDLSLNSASDIFSKYHDVPESLYNTIQHQTGNVMQQVKVASFKNPLQKPNSAVNADIEISSFTPKNISGGTKSVLIIRGSGFGNSMTNRNIFFVNADAPNTSLLAPVPLEYLSWSDTEIRLHVPADAGTGHVYLSERQNNAWTTIAQSKDTLVVRFARSNDLYSTRNPVNLVNTNRDGGYTWQMSKAFAENVDARRSLELVFDKWRCVSEVNWKLGALTDVNASVRDSLNVIHFAPASDFSSGTLGVCISRSIICGSTTSYVPELDLRFNNSAAWHFSSEKTPANLTDFQSVALHELGHALQLNHVVDTNDVMHYNIGKGTMRRFPSSGSIEGAKFVLQQSAAPQRCGVTNMLAAQPQLNCQVIVTNVQEVNSIEENVYPVPFQESCTIEFHVGSSSNVKLEIFDTLGNKVLQPINNFYAAGNYMKRIDFQNFPTGIYIYRLQVGNKTISKSIIRGI